MPKWTRKEVDELPDSSFAFVEPGGRNADGRTIPLSKRHLPYRDADGQVDLPHLRNALARLPRVRAEGLDAGKQAEIHAHLEKLLREADAG